MSIHKLVCKGAEKMSKNKTGQVYFLTEARRFIFLKIFRKRSFILMAVLFILYFKIPLISKFRTLTISG